MFKQKIDYFKMGNIFQPELEEKVKNYYQNELNLIKDFLPEEQTIILSVDESYLFYLSGKKNLLYENPQTAIGTKKDVDLCFKKTQRILSQKNCCQLYSFSKLCPGYQTYNYEIFDYQSVLLKKTSTTLPRKLPTCKMYQ